NGSDDGKGKQHCAFILTGSQQAKKKTAALSAAFFIVEARSLLRRRFLTRIVQPVGGLGRKWWRCEKRRRTYEIKELSHVVACGVTPGKSRQIETSFNQLQDRSVVAVDMRDEMRLHERRYHDNGNTEPAQREAFEGGVARGELRRNVVRRNHSERWHVIVE